MHQDAIQLQRCCCIPVECDDEVFDFDAAADGSPVEGPSLQMAEATVAAI